MVKKTSASFEESLDQCYDTAKKLLIKKKKWHRKIIKNFLKNICGFQKNCIIFALAKGNNSSFEISNFASIAQLVKST